MCRQKVCVLNQKLSLPGSSVCAIVKQARVTIQQKENKRNMSLFRGGKKSCILNGYANFSTHNPWLWSCSEYFRNGITVRMKRLFTMGKSPLHGILFLPII